MKIYIPFFISILLVTISCKKEKETIHLTGEAQGTTYSILYLDDEGRDYQGQIDSIFRFIDQSMSLWDSTSLISRINRGEDAEVDIHFATVFRKAEEISGKTDGAFDITVAPLVQGWGFGLKKAAEMDSATVDSLRQLVDFNRVKLEDGKIVRADPHIMLDFNAIAQGYTVDVIAAFLEDQKIKDYLIELGGELRARGKKADGSHWRVGIDKPIENTSAADRELQIVIELHDKSLATSGNYRKFYEKDGKRYSHTIDPKTGYPVTHNLLSVSVTADDCMTADAYATAFMVMGVEETQKFVSLHKDMDVFLVYDQNGTTRTWSTKEFEKFIKE